MSVLCPGIPVTGATLLAYGGVLLIDDAIYVFASMWPPHLQALQIALLEALTVLVGAVTWRKWITQCRCIFRCDNQSSVFAFNTLRSSNELMIKVVHKWEDLHEPLLFDGLLYWIPGVHNKLADLCSRAPKHGILPGLTAFLADQAHRFQLEFIDEEWPFHDLNLHAISPVSL